MPRLQPITDSRTPSETSEKSHSQSDSMDNTKRTQPNSVTFLDTNDVDGTPVSLNSTEPLYLRWSRLHKSVQIKEHNSGLIRSSIAASTPQPGSDLQKQQGNTPKVILDAVSGYAAPGEVLAMMG